MMLLPYIQYYYKSLHKLSQYNNAFIENVTKSLGDFKVTSNLEQILKKVEIYYISTNVYYL